MQQEIMRTADSIVDLKIKQARAVDKANNESLEVVRLYPKLDPESESFDKELSDTIAEATEAYVLRNPYTASVKQFVGKLMKPYQGSVAKEVGKATENIAKQVSEAALKPTTIRKPEKTATEKSIEELERELGIVQA